jgi:hypothetical protein
MEHTNADKRQELIKLYQAVYATECGKAVLDDIIRHCGSNRIAINWDDKATSAFYKAGMQEVGFYIKNKIDKEI